MLSVGPDTLFYPTEFEIMIRNMGSDTLRIDSLLFFDNRSSWELDLVLPDTTFRRLYYLFGRLNYQPEFPDVVLSSTDSAHVILRTYDSCPVCKGGVPSQTVRDTLIVYASNATGSPARVAITVADTELPTETPDELPALSVSVYPNPTSSPAEITVMAGRSGLYEATVYDVLGRHVFHQSKHVAAGAMWHLLWPLNAGTLPAGLYLIRVEAEGHATTKAITLLK